MGFAVLAAAIGGSSSCGGSTSSSAGGDAQADVCGFYAHLPNAPPYCPTAPGSSCVNGYCGLDSPPNGVACTAGAHCRMLLLIDPCPDWKQNAGSEEIDGYACACVDGKWSCALCWPGGEGCAANEAGTQDATTGG